MKTERNKGKLWLQAWAAACALALGWVELEAQDVELRAQLVNKNYNFTNPLDVTAPPGDTARLFVVEQAGRIRIVNLADDSAVATPFLDLSAASGGPVMSGGELGLLGLAFHPDYASNGYFFVNYTRRAGSVCVAIPPPGCTTDRAAETVVARFKVSGDPNRADATSQKVLLSFCQPYPNHNGGQLAFGPLDGYLYISTGDGGSGGDPCNSGQRTETYLGKLLRLDVDGGDPYAIPPTNPYAAMDDGIFDEIWALGLRNPWRFAFDQLTGDLYIGDVGQGAWEEVDFQRGSSSGGVNYEWDNREGKHNFSSTTVTAGTRIAPILEYPHGGGQTMVGNSVTGGVVYRGEAIPELHGTYFFADYTNHWVRTFQVDEGGAASGLRDRTAELNLGITPDRLDDITAFGTDGRGEVYFCDFPSKVFRVVKAPPPPKVFLRGNVNGDASIDISDAVFTLFSLFLGGEVTIDCQDALDSNDDGAANVTDAIYTLSGLFTGGPLPPAPYPTCGPDPTADALDCAMSLCTP